MFALQLGFTHFNLLKSILLRVDTPSYKCTWTKERKNCSKWPFNSLATKKLESELKVLILKRINIHPFLTIMALIWPDIDPKIEPTLTKTCVGLNFKSKNWENITFSEKARKFGFSNLVPKNQFSTRKSLFVDFQFQNYVFFRVKSYFSLKWYFSCQVKLKQPKKWFHVVQPKNIKKPYIFCEFPDLKKSDFPVYYYIDIQSQFYC